MGGWRHAVDGRRHTMAAVIKAAATVVAGIVAPVIERVVGPVGPEERVIGPFPVVPGADQCEVRRPGPPQVRVGPDHEAPATAIDVQDRVRAVVAVGLASVAEIAWIPDEVVAAVPQLEEPQIQGRVRVHVRTRRVVPGPTARGSRVNRMRPSVAVSAARNRIGRSLGIGRNRRRSRLRLDSGAGWWAILGRRRLLRLFGGRRLNVSLVHFLRDGWPAQTRDEPGHQQHRAQTCMTWHGQPRERECILDRCLQQLPGQGAGRLRRAALRISSRGSSPFEPTWA